jgi:hypothetical protein
MTGSNIANGVASPRPKFASFLRLRRRSRLKPADPVPGIEPDWDAAEAWCEHSLPFRCDLSGRKANEAGAP